MTVPGCIAVDGRTRRSRVVVVVPAAKDSRQNTNEPRSPPWPASPTRLDVAAIVEVGALSEPVGGVIPFSRDGIGGWEAIELGVVGTAIEVAELSKDALRFSEPTLVGRFVCHLFLERLPRSRVLVTNLLVGTDALCRPICHFRFVAWANSYHG
jgi:hypothetical protein